MGWEWRKGWRKWSGSRREKRHQSFDQEPRDAHCFVHLIALCRGNHRTKSAHESARPFQCYRPDGLGGGGIEISYLLVITKKV